MPLRSYSAFDRAAERECEALNPGLAIHVIFTNAAATRKSLKAASQMARDLQAHITILMAQVVPYPLPLANPPVPVELTERELLRMAREQDVETDIRVCLCRDRQQTIREGLRPESTVVIGGRKRWWPTAEDSLAKALRRDGHRVLLIEDGGNQ
jgi:hypothetical protein